MSDEKKPETLTLPKRATISPAPGGMLRFVPVDKRYILQQKDQQTKQWQNVPLVTSESAAVST
jgi:hypothetical protein